MSCYYQGTGCHNCSCCPQPQLSSVCADWNGQKLFGHFNRQNQCGEYRPISCTTKYQRTTPTLLKKQSFGHVLNREDAINNVIRHSGDPRKPISTKGSKTTINSNSGTNLNRSDKNDRNDRNKNERKKYEKNRDKKRTSTAKDKKQKSISKAKSQSKEYELCDILADCLVNKFKSMNSNQDEPKCKPCCDECECTRCTCHVQTDMTDFPATEVVSPPLEQKIPDKWGELNEDEKALLIAALKLKTNHANNVPIDGTNDSLKAGEDLRKTNTICECMRKLKQNTCCCMRKSKNKASEPYMQASKFSDATTSTSCTEEDSFSTLDNSKTSAVENLINVVKEIDGSNDAGKTSIEKCVDASTSMGFPNTRSQLETLLTTINLAECALEACLKTQGLLPPNCVGNARAEHFLDASTSICSPFRGPSASPLGSFLLTKTLYDNYDTMGPGLADSANRSLHRPYIHASTSMPFNKRNIQPEVDIEHALKENPSKKSKTSLLTTRSHKSIPKNSQKKSSKLSVTYLDASTSMGANNKVGKSPHAANINASTSMTSRKKSSRSSLASSTGLPSNLKANSSIGSPLEKSSRLPFPSVSTIPTRVPKLQTSNNSALEDYLKSSDQRSSLQDYFDRSTSMGSSLKRSTKSIFEEYIRECLSRANVRPGGSNGNFNPLTLGIGSPRRSRSFDRASRNRSANSIGFRNRSLSRVSSKGSASSGYSDKIIQVSLMSPDRSKPNVYAFVNKRENAGVPPTTDKVIQVSTALDRSGTNKSQTDGKGCRNQTFTFLRKCCSDTMVVGEDDDDDDEREQGREELAACLSCATAICNKCNRGSISKDAGKKKKAKRTRRR